MLHLHCNFLHYFVRDFLCLLHVLHHLHALLWLLHLCDGLLLRCWLHLRRLVCCRHHLFL